MSAQKAEVIVVGGGPAGLVATIAAARNGADTLLVERHGFLGGMVTAGLVVSTGGFHTEEGEQVIGGIPQEVIERTVALGSIGHTTSPVRPKKMTVTIHDEEVLKYAAMEMVQEAGAKVLLHSFAFGAIMENNIIKGIELVNKSGKQTIAGSTIIDASGDGDIAAAAGASFEKGRPEDGLCMPVTTVFKMDHVDARELLAYMEKNPEKFRKGAGWFRDIFKEKSPIVHCNFAGFAEEWEEAVRKGELPTIIDREHSGAGLMLNTPKEDIVYINMTRVIKVDITSGEGLTYGEIEGRRQTMMCVNWLKKYVPGFENARLVSTGPQVGVRESRRIIGEYVLTMEDVIEGRKFSDVIAKNAMGLDIHEQTEKGGHKWVPIKGGGSYDIPYRCLLPKKIDSLLVAGRCISTTQEAFTSARWVGPCMATGQAAGTAAALAVKEGLAPRKIDVSTLQKILQSQGAILFGTH